MNALTNPASASLRLPARHSSSSSRRVQQRSSVSRRAALLCRASAEEKVEGLAAFAENAKKAATGALASLSIAAALTGAPNVAVASEFDILGSAAPKDHVYDDAGVLSVTSLRQLRSQLTGIELATGKTVDVVTIRKLSVQPDPYDFADTILSRWYPNDDENRAIFLLSTTGKEAAIMAGTGFQDAVSGELVDSIETQNIPILTEEDKYNEAVISSIARIEAELLGRKDPGPPKREGMTRYEASTGSTYRTKEETEGKKDVFVNVVVALLVISFVAPMVQFFAYTKR